MSAPTRPSSAEPALTPRAGRCPHCGTAVEGGADAFCCHGCAVAFAIIRDAGLERYYAERTASPARPEPLDGAWAQVPVTPAEDGTCTARLAIDGLRCASCVWVTEHVLARSEGVAGVQVSYATGRTTLRWRPAETDLPTLAARIAALGYRPRPLGVDPAPDRGLLVKLGVASIATVAVMGLYEGLYAGWWYGAIDPRFAALFRWLSLVIATPVAIWCAAPFFTGAMRGLRHRVLHMDLPVAIGVLVLYVHGAVTTVLGTDGYLDSLTMLVALLLGGRLLESRQRRRAGEAATALVAGVPRNARRVAADGTLETVTVDALAVGDRIDAAAGEELAADGVVVEGAGQVRMALLTGEAEPVVVERGHRVVAGAVLLDGALTIAVQATGAATVLAQMAAELERAAEQPVRREAKDRIAPWFTAVTLGAALLTFTGWWWARSLGPAIAHTVAVLVVACPCALALARPLAAAAGLAAAARRGVLMRSADALLALDDIRTAALDKTGTVTSGTMRVLAADDATLRIAAGLERYSAHPIARAITAEAAARGIPLPQASDVAEVAGRGIAGVVDGTRWRLESGGPGRVTLVALGGAHDGATAAITLGDALRDDAARTVAALRAHGLRVLLLTGDHPEVAQRIARAAGIDEVIAGAEPATKARTIEALRGGAPGTVLFAGDGLNDGPALAAADIGVAMGSGVASSVLVADGVVTSASLQPLLAGLRSARAARRAVRFNERQSLVYNALMVALAMAGLVNPLVAAVLMPLSSLAVIWVATRVESGVRRLERRSA